MAKAKKATGGQNKSEAIRRVISQIGIDDAKPAAVIETLKAEGIEVSVGLVNAAKAKLRGGPKRSKASNGEPLTIVEIAELVKEAGGFQKLSALLEGGIVSKLATIASKGQLEELTKGVEVLAGLK